MGNEESQSQKIAQPIQPNENPKITSAPTNHPNKIEQQELQQQSEYDGIQSIRPLVARVLMKEEFPSDIHIDYGNLLLANQMVQQYFKQISQIISQNQDRITAQTKHQLEEYIEMTNLLHKRQNELDMRLAKMLASFRQFNDDITETVEILKNSIETADSLAAKIDPSLSFNTFQ